MSNAIVCQLTPRGRGANHQVLRHWNKSQVYAKTIALCAARLSD